MAQCPWFGEMPWLARPWYLSEAKKKAALQSSKRGLVHSSLDLAFKRGIQPGSS